MAALGLTTRCLYDIGVPHDARLIASDAATIAHSGPVESSMAIDVSCPQRVCGRSGCGRRGGSDPALDPHRKTKASASEIPGGLLAVKNRLVLHRNPTVALALAAQSSTDRLALCGGRFVTSSMRDTRWRPQETPERKNRSSAHWRCSRKRLDLLLMEAGLLAGRLGIEPAAAEKG